MKVLLLLQVHLWSLRNRVVTRIRRMRQIRYLAGTLAAVAYLVFILRPWRAGFWVGFFAGKPAADLEAAAAAVEIGLAAIVTILALGAWIWPGGKAALQFSEAEIGFLFPAPLTRRQVIDFSLIKSQIGIVIGVVLMGLLGLRYVAPTILQALIGPWIVITVLHLYFTGVSIVRSNLIRHGKAGLRRAWPALLAGGAVIAMIGASLVAGALRLPAPEERGQFARYVVEMGSALPLRWVLLPARAIVHPIIAGTFLSFLLSLVPAIAVLAAAYVWVIRSDFGYEETSAALAARRAARMSARARGERRYERVAATARKAPFRLAPSGALWRAIFWKNIVATWRITALPIVIGFAAVVASSSILLGGIVRPSWWARVGPIAGFQCLLMVGIFTLAGSEIVRTDLRMDLLNVDLLRSYPVTGPAVVYAEALVPATVMTLLQGLFLVATVLMLGGTWGISPGRWALMAAAVMVLAVPLNLLLALIHNAALILLPSWHHLGAGKARGWDALGVVLVGMLIRVVTLAAVLLPTAIVVAVVAFFGYPSLGLNVVPLAALAGAIPLLAECALGGYAVGLLFERFDPSRELDIAT